MKKILAILLTLGMVLSLAACGVTGGSTVEPVSEQTASEAESKTEEPAAIPAETVAPAASESQAAPAETPAATPAPTEKPEESEEAKPTQTPAAESEAAAETPEPTETPAAEAPAPALDGMEFVGEYTDPSTGSPALEISEWDNGSYFIQIALDGLANFEDGIGQIEDGGLAFKATDPSGEEIRGIITLNDTTATVTFTESTWTYIANGDSFVFEKTSDIPHAEG